MTVVDELFGAVEALLREADRAVEEFRAASSLACLPGCGHCCENPDVESTVLEAVPLARHLWTAGVAETWMDRLEAAGRRGTCVMYEPVEGVLGSGRCGIYPHRLLVCRLFGFASVPDKSGRQRLAACGPMRRERPRDVARADTLVDRGVSVPSFTAFSMRLCALDPPRGTARLPINEAIARAVEFVGLRLGLTDMEAGEKKTVAPDGRPDPFS